MKRSRSRRACSRPAIQPGRLARSRAAKSMRSSCAVKVCASMATTETMRSERSCAWRLGRGSDETPGSASGSKRRRRGSGPSLGRISRGPRRRRIRRIRSRRRKMRGRVVITASRNRIGRRLTGNDRDVRVGRGVGMIRRRRWPVGTVQLAIDADNPIGTVGQGEVLAPCARTYPTCWRVQPT